MHTQELGLCDGEFLLVVIIYFPLLGNLAIFQFTRRMKGAMLALILLNRISMVFISELVHLGSSPFCCRFVLAKGL